jgi:hypothetical protein
MSKELGDAALKNIVNNVLSNSKILQELRSNYRKELNSRYHILDLSEEALASVNLKSNSARKRVVFNNAYKQFINAIKEHVRGQIYNSIDDITTISKKTFYIENPPMLVSPSFEAARANITIVSQSIKNNKYFGISNRTRGLAELLSEGYTLESLEGEGRVFDPKSGQELELDKVSGKLIPRVRNLSKVDLGHTPSGLEMGRDSPLSEQFIRAASIDDSLSQQNFSNLSFIDDTPELDLTTVNQNISAIILNKLIDLSEIQANCVVSFKNEIPEKLASLTGDAGFLSLTLQLYNVNNNISVKESAVRNSLINEIKEEIRKVVLQIPGSNTVQQDIVELARQRIIDGITGKGSTSKLENHAVLGTALKNTSKNTTKLNLDSKSIKIATNTSSKPNPIRTLSGQFYSLASLQQLLNANLQNVIAANMGDGSQRNILNYRTGRFAGSVKVENMSQSRKGMITAFYSYMKNPYQTFEPGFRQGSPKTRDPKLLIAKSIREIAETRVANRMRAMSI